MNLDNFELHITPPEPVLITDTTCSVLGCVKDNVFLKQYKMDYVNIAATHEYIN